MHLLKLGKADRFSGQTLDPGPEIQVFTLNLLGISLADYMLVLIQISFIGTPVIRIKTLNTKGFQECLELLKYRIFSLAKNISKNSVGCMIYRMPKPALIGFSFDKGPLLVKLCRITGELKTNLIVRTQPQSADIGVNLNDVVFFAPDNIDDCRFTDLENPAGIPNTASVDSHVNNLFLNAKSTGFITILQHEAFGGAVWILADITLHTVAVKSTLPNFCTVAASAADFCKTYHPLYDRDGCSIFYTGLP